MKIKYHAVVLLLSLLAVGCGDDTSLAPSPSGTDSPDNVNFEINVYAGDPEDARSRSSSFSRDTDQDGYAYEFGPPDYSPERMHTLRVIIVRPSGEIEANEYLYRSFPQDGASEFHGLRFKVVGGEKKTIYLFANEASIPGLDLSAPDYRIGAHFPAEAMTACTFSTSRAGQPFIDNTGDVKTNVPMTEVFEIGIKAPETEEDYYQTANLFITRALVKFSFTVQAADAPSVAYSIDELTIRSVASTQYLIPNSTSYTPAKYDAGGMPSFEDRYIYEYATPADAMVGECVFNPTNLNFPVDYTPGTTLSYAPQLYFPETALPVATGATAQEYILAVKLSGDEEPCAEVPLPNLPSLPRNTHVKVNISLKNSDVKCTVDVVPYTAVPLNPSFGFDQLLPRPPIEPGVKPPWVTIDPDNPDSNKKTT